MSAETVPARPSAARPSAARRDPLLLDIPTVLQTPRLALHLPVPGDGARIYTSVAASVVELRPWMPWARAPTVDSIETFVRTAIADFHRRAAFNYTIYTVEDGQHVGNIGAHNIRWHLPSFEIGYWCSTPATGRGYITEATRALTQMLFASLGAVRVEIRMDARNLRSAAVPERLGFPYEGTLHQDERGVEGELRDTRIYARVSAEGL